MIGIYQGNLRCNMFLVVLDIFFFFLVVCYLHFISVAANRKYLFQGVYNKLDQTRDFISLLL